MSFKVPEKYRTNYPRGHHYYSDISFGNNGVFYIPISNKRGLNIIASDGGGWEHVSVSLSHRMPTYEEMKRVRRLFWGAEDVVVEYHMGEVDHIDIHPYTLHLWKHAKAPFPVPPKVMV